jgi:hypothetical protein
VPDSTGINDESITVGNNASAEVLVDPYVTDLNFPNIETIPAGIWMFNMRHYVDNAGDVTNAVYRVFKIPYNGGAETDLFGAIVSAEINATVATTYVTNYTQVSPVSNSW